MALFLCRVGKAILGLLGQGILLKFNRLNLLFKKNCLAKGDAFSGWDKDRDRFTLSRSKRFLHATRVFAFWGSCNLLVVHLPQKLDIFRFLPVTRLLLVYLQWNRGGRRLYVHWSDGRWDACLCCSGWDSSEVLLALVGCCQFMLSLEYDLIWNMVFKGRYYLDAGGDGAVSTSSEYFTSGCGQFDCVSRCLELLTQLSIYFLLRWLVARCLNLD